MHVGLVARGDTAYAFDLANVLENAGLSVSLYVSYEHTVREVGTVVQPVQRLYDLGLLNPGCRVRLIKPPRMRNLNSLGTYYGLARIIKKDGVQLVHILAGPHEPWLAILAYFLRGIPVVGTMIVPTPNPGDDLAPFAGRFINRLLTHGCDMLIVNGADQMKSLRSRYGIAATRAAYVPLCARTLAVTSTARSNPEEPHTILFFGAARLHKGLEYLVRAQPAVSQQVQALRILISSRGEELQRCRSLIHDESKFEIHDGYASAEGMAALFQRASLVVLPYLSASTSGVLMIAYSFGKPVVASKVGCLPEYVEDNVTGVLVEPANVEQLAAALIRLLSDDALRHRMGAAGKRWVEAQNKEVATRTIEVYEATMALCASSPH